MVVPVEAARQFYPERPSFADLLLAIPEPLDAERDQTPLSPADIA